MVVQPRALELAVVHAEAQRLDQVQPAAGVGAQPDHVAGVGRDLGLVENDARTSSLLSSRMKLHTFHINGHESIQAETTGKMALNLQLAPAAKEALPNDRKGTMPRPEKVRLGEILLQQKLLTEEQLQDALDEQKRSGRKLGRVFVEKGFVSEEQISTALARQLQVPYINLKHFTVKPEVAMRLPETQARRFRALVLEDAGALLPGRHGRPDRPVRLRRDVALAQARHPARGGHRVAAAADHRPRLPPHRGDHRPGRRSWARSWATAGVDFGALGDLRGGRGRTGRASCCRRVFEDAVQVRASDIHIEPQETQAASSASASTACCTCRPRPTPRSPRRWCCA